MYMFTWKQGNNQDFSDPSKLNSTMIFYMKKGHLYTFYFLFNTFVSWEGTREGYELSFSKHHPLSDLNNMEIAKLTRTPNL